MSDYFQGVDYNLNKEYYNSSPEEELLRGLLIGAGLIALGVIIKSIVDDNGNKT